MQFAVPTITNGQSSWNCANPILTRVNIPLFFLSQSFKQQQMLPNIGGNRTDLVEDKLQFSRELISRGRAKKPPQLLNPHTEEPGLKRETMQPLLQLRIFANNISQHQPDSWISFYLQAVKYCRSRSANKFLVVSESPQGCLKDLCQKVTGGTFVRLIPKQDPYWLHQNHNRLWAERSTRLASQWWAQQNAAAWFPHGSPERDRILDMCVRKRKANMWGMK